MGVALLSLVLAPLIPRFIEVRRQSIDARNWVVATSLGAGKLEELKSLASFPERLDPESREVNGTVFDLVPSAILVDPLPGLEKARPPVVGYRLGVQVLWNLPGTPGKKHHIGLQTLLVRPKPL
ncbi:MAG: hypothetical protein OZSIB_1640 [Candidatus Ozemobacter sibiricus]|jgi:hypothetical protein|uniref:Uncharacterized protein n=1 Tax=Candidatus Ozemobacter sibiricus TaxID=2268124 RepID=A0A367ZJF4_9BACT|nr:MAG: hypothetical protein OZSIB_1640 [Candidatus Ozemobacter sibiricus]